jgi:hypothetical protein
MTLKAELHCHVEGAADTELVAAQACKYGADMSPFINGDSFVWHDFTSFLAAYDAASALFRTEEDYALLSEHYLTTLAQDGAIYSEIFVSPDHATAAGLSPAAYVTALGEGMRRACVRHGIEGRMIVIGVRHFGADTVEAAARFAAGCGEPLVTGFAMAGEERFGHARDYERAFDIAREAGLGITVHAGELAGADSVRSALDHFRPARLGHGVRAIEDGTGPPHCRRRRRAGDMSRLERRAAGLFRLCPPSLSGAQGCRLQGDAQFRRSTLFRHLAGAGIRHRGGAFRLWQGRSARDHAHGAGGGLRRRGDTRPAPRAARRGNGGGVTGRKLWHMPLRHVARCRAAIVSPPQASKKKTREPAP